MQAYHLDYCDVIYHIPHGHAFPFTLNSLMEKLERIQYSAALAITGTWRGTNRYKLYEELGWKSLNDRLIQFYKTHNNLTPGYLRENLPPVHHPHISSEQFFFQIQLNYGISWVKNFKCLNLLKYLKSISHL